MLEGVANTRTWPGQLRTAKFHDLYMCCIH